ncbi:MAG: NAD(P)-dependent oxidoreductase [Clostridia bacterium]|nr:NAD(P)-dependent oxidoreductase [Clostridia bacterium]
MKRVIVTGATGMIAVALIKKLIKENIRVYALCKPGTADGVPALQHPLVTVIDADISEFSAAKDKIDEKCDVLYHFAWLGTFGQGRDDPYLQLDNIRYAVDCVKLAHETGCNMFVGAGSQAEYGPVTQKLTAATPTDPVTGYGMAKYAAGKLTRLYADSLGLTHIWVRILSVFGVGSIPNSIIPSSIDKFIKKEHAAFTKGEQIWDFLYCDDAAAAFYLIGKNARESKIYPLGSGESRTLADYITAMRDTVDPDAPLALGELPYNPGQAMYLCADISALTADTGFKPEIGFEKGIEITAAWRREVLGSKGE